jgi:hypothetical protein
MMSVYIVYQKQQRPCDNDLTQEVSRRYIVVGILHSAGTNFIQ